MYSLCHLCQSVATCDKILERGLGLLRGEAAEVSVLGCEGGGGHHPLAIVHGAPELGEVVLGQAVPGQLLLHQTHDLHLRKVRAGGEVCKSGTVTAASLCFLKV